MKICACLMLCALGLLCWLMKGKIYQSYGMANEQNNCLISVALSVYGQ